MTPTTVPAALRRSLLTVPQSRGLCLRLAVRAIESWLLADAAAFSNHFAVSRSRVPAEPERERQPKQTLVELCRASKRRDVRSGVVPPRGMVGVGPEYTTMIAQFCRDAWRPDAAAEAAPSLARALAEIDNLLTSGTWS